MGDRIGKLYAESIFLRFLNDIFLKFDQLIGFIFKHWHYETLVESVSGSAGTSNSAPSNPRLSSSLCLGVWPGGQSDWAD